MLTAAKKNKCASEGGEKDEGREGGKEGGGEREEGREGAHQAVEMCEWDLGDEARLHSESPGDVKV